MKITASNNTNTNTSIDFGKKKKRRRKRKRVKLEPNNDDEYHALLKRAQILKDEHGIGTHIKTTHIPPPQLARSGTRRMLIRNFVVISNTLNRDTQHIAIFIEKELGLTEPPRLTTNGLSIKGRYDQIDIQTLFTKYINRFVLCSQCKSLNTILQKKNKLTFNKCNGCQSSKCIKN